MDHEKLEEELRTFPKDQQLSDQAKEQFLMKINEESDNRKEVQRSKHYFNKRFLSIAGVAAVFLISFLLYSNFNQTEAPANELSPKESAMEGAKTLKQMQFDVNYEETVKERDKESNVDLQVLYDSTYEKYKDVVTEEGFMEMWMTNQFRYGEDLSLQTKTNISVKDITFEIGLKDTDTELSLDYYIDVLFESVEKEDTEKVITIFGQMRMIKSEERWKVEKDIQQGNDEIRALYE